MKNLLILSLLAALLTSCQKEEPSPPNIILIFCDDLGYGDLGVYGHPTIHTPNLDAMAAGGIKFTNFYSGSPACTASRYALLTGRYPVHSGFDWVLYPRSSTGIHPREVTLAEGLKSAGYTTACFGKWHLGSIRPEYLPMQNGFDEFLGLPYSNDMLPPRHPEIALLDGNDTLEMGPDQRTLTRRYTERALQFMEKNSDRPFFLYLPYAMPHLPLHPGEDFAGTSARGTYGDVVEEIDWSVGEILRAVEAAGLAENTLVFFTSDNGPWIIKKEEGGSSGLLRDGKGSTWEGGMRVPGIAWWKGVTSAGSIVQTPVSTLDLYTTFLTIGGYDFSDGHHRDGRDISGVLKQGGDGKVEERPFFYYGPRQLHAVRKGKWKLHLHTSSQTGADYFEGRLPLLFNLSEDPSEQYDLSEEHPEIVADLQTIAEKHIAAVPVNYHAADRAASRIKHLAVGKSVRLKNAPDPRYGKPDVLTDGFREEPDAFQRMPGFETTDFEAIIDLGSNAEVGEISIGFFQVPGSWIFSPEEVHFYGAADTRSFRKLHTAPRSATIDGQTENIYRFRALFNGETMRYIKIEAPNRLCPDWHEGKGKPCWLFADEIIVH